MCDIEVFSNKWVAIDGVSRVIVLNFINLKGLLLIPTLSCMNKGEPISNNTTKYIHINNGEITINTNTDKKISAKRINYIYLLKKSYILPLNMEVAIQVLEIRTLNQFLNCMRVAR